MIEEILGGITALYATYATVKHFQIMNSYNNGFKKINEKKEKGEFISGNEMENMIQHSIDKNAPNNNLVSRTINAIPRHTSDARITKKQNNFYEQAWIDKADKTHKEYETVLEPKMDIEEMKRFVAKHYANQPRWDPKELNDYLTTPSSFNVPNEFLPKDF